MLCIILEQQKNSNKNPSQLTYLSSGELMKRIYNWIWVVLHTFKKTEILELFLPPHQGKSSSPLKAGKQDVPGAIPGSLVDLAARNFPRFSQKLAKIRARIPQKDPYGGHSPLSTYSISGQLAFTYNQSIIHVKYKYLM